MGARLLPTLQWDELELPETLVCAGASRARQAGARDKQLEGHDRESSQARERPTGVA